MEPPILKQCYARAEDDQDAQACPEAVEQCRIVQRRRYWVRVTTPPISRNSPGIYPAQPHLALPRVRAITMEVHPAYGDNEGILSRLRQYGFRSVAANEDLEPVADPRHANFIYAWRAG
jgi:hypothetical protein